MYAPLNGEHIQRDYVFALFKAGLLIPGVKTGNEGHDIAVNFANQRGIELSEFFGTTKVRDVARARQECMALIKAKTGLSDSEIGRIFNRDRTTVMHGLKAHADRQEATQ